MIISHERIQSIVSIFIFGFVSTSTFYGDVSADAPAKGTFLTLAKIEALIISQHAWAKLMGPIWAESGHDAQIGPMWVPYRNFSTCGTHIGPL